MAFARPSLAALIERIAADIDADLEGANARLSRSPEGVLARAQAAAVHGLHGHLDWLAKQLLPDTADEDYVLRWGEIFGVARTAAAKASGTLSGTGTVAAELPSGTELVSSDGVEFVTTALATVDGDGEFTVAIEAVDAGADGNIAAGVVLRLSEPASGIDSELTTVGDGITDGLDIEDIEDYRLRVLDRIANPPLGGGSGDYVAWAKEVSGVTRAWEQPLALGPGTVRVLFVRDNDTGSIVPDADEVAELQDYLQERDEDDNIIGGVAPIFATVTAVAPSTSNLDVTVAVALAPGYSLADVTTNITAELEDMLLELAAPDGTIRLSQIREAISRAEGESYHTLSVPASDQTYAATVLPVLGTVIVTEI